MEKTKKENDDTKTNNPNIIEKIKNCICFIENKNILGFFCKFPLSADSKIFKGLLINCDNINLYNDRYLLLSLDIFKNDYSLSSSRSRIIILDDSRKIYKFSLAKIALIEIKEEDEISDFLDIDFNAKIENNYLKSIEREQSLPTLGRKEDFDLSLLYGLFSENDKSLFMPPISTNFPKKGCPILSSNNYKVVGIHCGKSESLNLCKGTFFKVKINENTNKNYEKIEKIKNYEINNEINIKYKIEDDTIKIKLFGEEFVKNNKDDFKIILEDKEQELCSELDITEKMKNKKILEIKLKQYNIVYNLSNMFEGCKQLISISELSNLNTTEVINMDNFFYDCTLLTSLSSVSN